MYGCGMLIHLSLLMGDISYICLCGGCIIHLSVCMGDASYMFLWVEMSHTSVCVGAGVSYICLSVWVG